MNFDEVIYCRQSIRSYKDQDIPNMDIKRVLDAGRVAPSGKNCQNWYFIVLKNREIIEALCSTIFAANQEIVEQMKKIDIEKALRFEKFCKNFTLFIRTAPVVILTFAKTYYPSGYFEKKLCGKSDESLKELVMKTNPGMQSIGAAMDNMALEAVNLHYGSCWLTSANYAAAEIEALLKKRIGFEKEGYFFAGMMTLGIPRDILHKSPERKSLNEISLFVE